MSAAKETLEGIEPAIAGGKIVHTCFTNALSATATAHLGFDINTSPHSLTVNRSMQTIIYLKNPMCLALSPAEDSFTIMTHCYAAIPGVR